MWPSFFAWIMSPSRRERSRSFPSLLDTAEAAEAVVVVVPPGRRQRTRRRHLAVAAAADVGALVAGHHLPRHADHALHGGHLRHAQRAVAEEAGAHDRVGLGQRL